MIGLHYALMCPYPSQTPTGYLPGLAMAPTPVQLQLGAVTVMLRAPITVAVSTAVPPESGTLRVDARPGVLWH